MLSYHGYARIFNTSFVRSLHLTEETIHTAQLFLLYFIIGLRICFVRLYTQSYLFSPAQIVVENAKLKNEQHFEHVKEKVNIKWHCVHVNTYLFQLQVLNFLRFLLVAALQLFAFPLLLVPFAVLLNSKANFSFTSNSAYKFLSEVSGTQALHTYLGNDFVAQVDTQWNKIYAEALGFLLFWICVSVSAISVMGFAFYKAKASLAHKDVKTE